jgi:UDP:flavonoid glycosyltransferase YjiC (YdhE family)
MQHLSRELIPRQFRFLAEAGRDADLMVGAGVQLAAASVCERYKIPYVAAVFTPAAIPNAHVPPPTPLQRLPQPLIRLAWLLGLAAASRALRPAIDEGRRSLRLPPLSRPMRALLAGDVLLAADRELAPPPLSLPARTAVTDAWVLEEQGALEPDLDRFLRDGDSPVYVGFGSMTTDDPDHVTRVVLDAAERAGTRLLLGRGWTGLGVGPAQPSWCRSVGDVPHHLLFPRVTAVVHHGGAGTTTSAARAGVPQVIVPHVLDQFYWGERVRTLGLGPAPLRMKHLSAGALADRLREVPAFRERAKDLGARTAARTGVEEAVQVLERIAGGSSA